MISPPALRTDIISKALSLSARVRTESAATMKESNVPLIQKRASRDGPVDGPLFALRSARPLPIKSGALLAGLATMRPIRHSDSLSLVPVQLSVEAMLPSTAN